ncbi:hypothetical protein CROQUDRAFT_37163 [Cronartium quercuum f. sp. fusiforme G11]|uniref:Uncharacterized protein n=1 Tax=Cronartium quercuum f. sp. fusiforme G11 TaxID=708437 RepID=A0A9P6TH06_9BASI|nr:hypothetical protein CROQUDRAFT_37163 [Cronartium quercuum f. sp. fusiforme G11]
MSTTILSNSLSSDPRTFGTPIQQFTQRLMSALSKYVFEEKLTDENYSDWALSVEEALMEMEYIKYIKKNTYRAPSLSDEEHLKVKFVLTTWMLGVMDSDNHRRCGIELSVRKTKDFDSDDDDDDDLSMTYDPYILWKYLKEYHYKITEGKFRIIDDALHDMKIARSDSYIAYCDKFNELLRDFYKFKGEMTDTQSAHLLVKTIKPHLSDVTLELIYASVIPLTCQKLINYLKEYESRHGGFITPSVTAANLAESTTTGVSQPPFRLGSRRFGGKCT